MHCCIIISVVLEENFRAVFVHMKISQVRNQPHAFDSSTKDRKMVALLSPKILAGNMRDWEYKTMYLIVIVRVSRPRTEDPFDHTFQKLRNPAVWYQSYRYTNLAQSNLRDSTAAIHGTLLVFSFTSSSVLR